MTQARRFGRARGLGLQLAFLIGLMLLPGMVGDQSPPPGEAPMAAQAPFARALELHQGGRYRDAETLYRRALAMRERSLGPESPLVAIALTGLAGVLQAQGRHAEAEPLHRRAVAIREAVLGPSDPDFAESLAGLAAALRAEARYAEAEPLERRALAIREQAFGATHPAVAASLNGLGQLLWAEGRYDEAEPLQRRALAINEKVLGPEHPQVAVSLNNLALLLHSQGLYAEAEPAYRRAMAIRDKLFGPSAPSQAVTLNNLAELLRAQERNGEAEALDRSALAVREQALGPKHPDVAQSLNNLVLVLRAQGRYGEAEPLQRRAVAILAEVDGLEHPHVAIVLSNLAVLLRYQGRYAEAEPLQRQALVIEQSSLGPDHPYLAIALDNLSQLLAAQGRQAEALDASRRATGILVNRFARATGSRSGGQAAEQHTHRGKFLQLVSLLAAGQPDRPEPSAAALDEAFRAAQLAGEVETARAVSGMAARFAAGSDALAAAVRERQDLLERWRTLDRALIKAASNPPQQRNRSAEDDIRRSLADTDALLLALDARLASEFPRYAEVANPRPGSIQEVQALIGDDEALLAWSVAAGETFLFALRHDRAMLRRIAVSAAELKEMVARLRAGLDPPDRLRSFDDVPRYDAAAAHALYRHLLAPAEPLLAGARLVFAVPDGALQSLPLSVLMAAEPPTVREFADYAKLPWLARRFAISVLPAVSSLRALRLFAEQARAANPFAGFGDPLFDGAVGGTRSVRSAGLFRGGLADVAEVRLLARLPGTAFELRALAGALKAPEDSLRLRERASEAAVKSVDLHDVRVLAFATHGLVAGELSGLAEPALALTPPGSASTADDGLLTASEVAQLRLNADWVMLSACNTAASDGTDGAEGLSGLAKAFFYAGARSLMVSHWSVESDAAVGITTGAFRAMERDPTIGRSEALRRSMLAMIDNSGRDHDTRHLATRCSGRRSWWLARGRPDAEAVGRPIRTRSVTSAMPR